jgi:hypothetical protein
LQRRRISIRLHVRHEASAADSQAGWNDVVSSSHALPDRTSTTLHGFLQDVLPASWPERAAVLVQGIQPPLDAPLETLHTHLRGPDGFVHICVLLGRELQH